MSLHRQGLAASFRSSFCYPKSFNKNQDCVAFCKLFTMHFSGKGFLPCWRVVLDPLAVSNWAHPQSPHGC